jgi:putative transposase
LPPTQIVPALADEGRYIGSESTFYRVLKERGQVNPRGRAKVRVTPTAPTTHIAKGPNEVWMMDVTWLPSRVRGRFFYLYMIEDLYSRFGVYWEVFEEEHGEHTSAVVEKAMWRERCMLAPPILHSDNGSALKAQTVQQKLLQMGITASHSRPRVSNDNAFVESMFRSLKYCPMWPSQGFATIEDAREWVQRYMHWYNHGHRHSGIQFVTPAQRHHGEDGSILANRRALYAQARTARPDRWRRNTRNWDHEGEVALNPVRSAQSKS